MSMNALLITEVVITVVSILLGAFHVCVTKGLCPPIMENIVLVSDCMKEISSLCFVTLFRY